MYACLCMYMHNARPSQLLSTLSFEIGSFNEPGVHNPQCWGQRHGPLLYLVLPGARELSSGSHIRLSYLHGKCCTDGTISPASAIFFLCKWPSSSHVWTLSRTMLWYNVKSLSTLRRKDVQKTTVGTFKLISILGNGVCMKKKTKEHEAWRSSEGYLVDGVRTGKLRLARTDSQQERASVR